MISTVVLTKNEEENIGKCLETLKWCDEIIVVDDNSQDKTCNIAKRAGAEVFIHPFKDNFAEQRNFGLEKTKGEWVFFVDADERVEKVLAGEIMEAVKGPNFTGFFVKRKDFIFGRWLKYGESGNIKLLRLARKGAGRWVRPVHEVWDVKGKIGGLRNSLLHYPHPTVVKFLKEINFYTTLNAEEFYHQGEWVGLESIIFYPLGKFFLNYFFKLGFLDGMPGLITALMMSFHSFLTRGKLWLLYRQNRFSPEI